MSNNYVVYTISFQGKVMYVGKTYNFTERKRNHLKYRGTNYSSIPEDIDLSLIEFNILAKFDQEEDALKFEGQRILEYDTINNGWNIKKSGLITHNQKEYTQNYQQEHREQVNAYVRNWRKTHKEQSDAANKKYKATHREQVNAYAKKYREEHREQVNAYQRAHYAAKKAAMQHSDNLD